MPGTLSEGSLFGPFRVIGVLGHGGMGSVYRVTWEARRGEAALKVMLPNQSGEQLRRFQREVTATAGLKHPGIVRVLDHGLVGDAPYYAMELLDCPTLAEILRVASASGHAVMDQAAFRRLFTGMLDALGHAHARRIVHRDLKPANVFVKPSGDPVLVDFGLAHLIDHTALTASGAAIGTPSHMAPEQILGKPVDARTDLFQVGLLMYEVLTGRLPFSEREGGFAQALARLSRQIPPPSVANPGVPPMLDRVVLRCLSVEKEARHPDAATLAEELRAILGDGAEEPRSTAVPAALTSGPGTVAVQRPASTGRMQVAEPRRRFPVRAVALATAVNLAGFVLLYRALAPPRAAELIEAVHVTPGETSARVTFRTARPAVGLVEFGPRDPPDRMQQEDGPPSMDHVLMIEELEPGHDYLFRVVAETAPGERRSGALHGFRTSLAGPAGVAAPERVLNARLDTGRDWLDITFATDGPVRSRLLLLDGAAHREVTISATPEEAHHVRVHGLKPATRYGFQLLLVRPDGAVLRSIEQSAMTST